MRPAESKIEPGDRLETAAYELGVSPEALWNHPRNTELRELRGTPANLEPGDVLVAPEIRVKREPAKPGAPVRFRRKHAPAWLRLRMWIDDQPRAKGQCALVAGSRLFRLDLDDEGAVVCPVPITAKKAQLLLFHGARTPDVDLDLRQPLTEVELEVEETLLKIEAVVSFRKPAEEKR